ncbi:MAG: hypothetical protein JXA30_00785 [Deltaproteobacteria bacterium]|nr:hypothetical protein [Deltaproteobacteria bacterium]
MSTVVLITSGAGKTYAVSTQSLQKISGKIPHVVIWDGDTVMTLPEKGVTTWEQAIENEGNNSSAFGEFLKYLERRQSTDYVMFAVRPSGFARFYYLKNMVTKRKIDIGYEPFSQESELVVMK